jgi:hypothetical protein
MDHLREWAVVAQVPQSWRRRSMVPAAFACIHVELNIGEKKMCAQLPNFSDFGIWTWRTDTGMSSLAALLSLHLLDLS